MEAGGLECIYRQRGAEIEEISEAENLDELFDYSFFIRWRDESFRRAGLI